VRSSPEFLANNRTMGGGQWDEALKAIAPAGWNIDQFSDDLASGDVGQLNILEPDQCDDMHGVTLVAPCRAAARPRRPAIARAMR
jgi:hypothetical protein